MAESADNPTPKTTSPGGSLPIHPLAMGAPRPKTPSSGGLKSSTAIKLGTLGVLSVLIVGACATANDYEEVDADCVDTTTYDADASYVVVDDYYCDDDDDGGGSSNYSGSNGYTGSHGAYRWYYGGNRVGNRVRNGTTIRPARAHITTRSGRVVQRGGFGFHFGGGS